MPLVKNTVTGNHYLVKINTDSDTCLRTAIRSYSKHLGVEGTTGNTIYQLPFTYEPYSYTLWIFVNGQKAEFLPGGSSIGEQLLTYTEPTERTVEFWDGLNDDDVIEFYVIGSYLNDAEPTTTSGVAWSRITSNIDALSMNGYLVDTSSNIVSVTLPSSPVEGDIVSITDNKGTFASNNCTINRNGNNIMGLLSNYVMNFNNQGIQLVFDGVDDWRITASV